MMKASDLGRPGVIALSVAAAAALGFAAGYLVARNPELLRRWAGLLAGSVERLTGSAAETREHLADLWAQAREDALQATEEASFAAAEAAAAVSAAQRRSSGSSGASSETPARRRAASSGRRKTGAGSGRKRATRGDARADGV
jgi:hypothetical protein